MGEDTTSKVLMTILLLVFGFLIFSIWRSTQTTEVTEMAVIKVDYDKFRACTFVYDANGHKSFAGLHYEIKVGIIYRFTYKRGIPWSHLIDTEIVRTFDLTAGGIS